MQVLGWAKIFYHYTSCAQGIDSHGAMLADCIRRALLRSFARFGAKRFWIGDENLKPSRWVKSQQRSRGEATRLATCNFSGKLRFHFSGKSTKKGARKHLKQGRYMLPLCVRVHSADSSTWGAIGAAIARTPALAMSAGAKRGTKYRE